MELKLLKVKIQIVSYILLQKRQYDSAVKYVCEKKRKDVLIITNAKRNEVRSYY